MSFDKRGCRKSLLFVEFDNVLEVLIFFKVFVLSVFSFLLFGLCVLFKIIYDFMLLEFRVLKNESII